jgi:hypothetical protein
MPNRHRKRPGARKFQELNPELPSRSAYNLAKQQNQQQQGPTRNPPPPPPKHTNTQKTQQAIKQPIQTSKPKTNTHPPGLDLRRTTTATILPPQRNNHYIAKPGLYAYPDNPPPIQHSKPSSPLPSRRENSTRSSSFKPLTWTPPIGYNVKSRPKLDPMFYKAPSEYVGPR